MKKTKTPKQPLPDMAPPAPLGIAHLRSKNLTHNPLLAMTLRTRLAYRTLRTIFPDLQQVTPALLQCADGFYVYTEGEYARAPRLTQDKFRQHLSMIPFGTTLCYAGDTVVFTKGAFTSEWEKLPVEINPDGDWFLITHSVRI